MVKDATAGMTAGTRQTFLTGVPSSHISDTKGGAPGTTAAPGDGSLSPRAEYAESDNLVSRPAEPFRETCWSGAAVNSGEVVPGGASVSAVAPESLNSGSGWVRWCDQPCQAGSTCDDLTFASVADGGSSCAELAGARKGVETNGGGGGLLEVLKSFVSFHVYPHKVRGACCARFSRMHDVYARRHTRVAGCEVVHSLELPVVRWLFHSVPAATGFLGRGAWCFERQHS